MDMINLGTIFAGSTPATGASYFTSALTPTRDASSLRISFVAASGSTLTMTIYNGTTTKTVTLLDGATCTAGRLYTQLIPCRKKDQNGNALSYNFIPGSLVGADWLTVDEVIDGVTPK